MLDRRSVMRCMLSLCACLLVLSTTPATAKTLHSERSLYRNILVFEEDGLRCMAFGRYRTGRQSCISLTAPDHLVLEYTRMMMAGLYFNPNPQRVLIIGLGGGILPSLLPRMFPQVEIDVAEIDPAVVRVAHQYFGLREREQTHIYEQDGRVFVKRMLKQRASYDLIMLDAFDHDYIPEHLLTREFLTEVRGLLSEHGVLVANTFSSSRLYASESATYAAVFGTFYNLRRANRVIVVRRDGLLSTAEIEANAVKLDAALTRYGVSRQWLVPLISTDKDWPSNATVLTDQYSPSNLLNR